MFDGEDVTPSGFEGTNKVGIGCYTYSDVAGNVQIVGVR